MKYPPVSNMVSVLLQSKNQGSLNTNVQWLVNCIKEFKEKYFEDLMVIGPADPPVGKINDVYRKIVYLKSDNRIKMVGLKNYLEDVIKNSQNFKNISVQFDFKA